MAYEFQTDAFDNFAMVMRDYPEGVPDDPEALQQLSELYLAATAALFKLMALIMATRLRGSIRGERYGAFLSIYDHRVAALIELLRDFLIGGLSRDQASEVADFLEGVRQGAIAEEMVALKLAVDSSSGEGEDAEADESAGTTVTNSLKEQIERRVKAKWVKDILHAINEVLSVARGVA